MRLGFYPDPVIFFCDISSATTSVTTLEVETVKNVIVPKTPVCLWSVCKCSHGSEVCIVIVPMDVL